MFSQVTLIVESALAHAGTVVSEGEVVIGVSPSERLSGGEDGSLNLLVVVTHFCTAATATLDLLRNPATNPLEVAPTSFANRQ